MWLNLDLLNRELLQGKVESVYAALKELTRVVEGANSFLFQSYAEKYFNALKRELREGIPCSVLVNHMG